MAMLPKFLHDLESTTKPHFCEGTITLYKRCRELALCHLNSMLQSICSTTSSFR